MNLFLIFLDRCVYPISRSFFSSCWNSIHFGCLSESVSLFMNISKRPVVVFRRQTPIVVFGWNVCIILHDKHVENKQKTNGTDRSIGTLIETFHKINNGRKVVELMRLINPKKWNKRFPKQIIKALNLAHAFHNIVGRGSSQERFAH